MHQIQFRSPNPIAGFGKGKEKDKRKESRKEERKGQETEEGRVGVEGEEEKGEGRLEDGGICSMELRGIDDLN